MGMEPKEFGEINRSFDLFIKELQKTTNTRRQDF
jgi:hypothetical protein